MSILNNTAMSGTQTSEVAWDIDHSLRISRTPNSYLTRTYGTPTSSTKGLISVWVKNLSIGSNLIDVTFMGQEGNVNNFVVLAGVGALGTDRNHRLAVRIGGTSQDYWAPRLRDPAAFTHYLISIDSTQAVQANRAIAYANGVLIPKGFSSITLNQVITFFTSGNKVLLSSNVTGYYTEGYFARYAYLDGVCLQDSSASIDDFGFINPETGQWTSRSQSQILGVVEASGDNSFLLDFDDGTSLTTLGYDKSSKGNDWTLTNVSLTAGPAYDWMDDVPGNSLPTYNILTVPTAATFSRAGMTMVGPNAVATSSTMIPKTGKWYAEVLVDRQYAAAQNYNGLFGITKVQDIEQFTAMCVNGETSGPPGGLIRGVFKNGVRVQDVAGVAINDILAFELDMDELEIQFYRNGTAYGSLVTLDDADYVIYSQTTGTTSSDSARHNINFGHKPFSHTPTVGFVALSQANLPAVIDKPSEHFDVQLYAGNGTSVDVTSNDFEPGLLWIKGRATATFNNHILVDKVRGIDKILQSNNTENEATAATAVTAIDESGFSIGAFDDVNTNGNNYVSWLWKSNGSGMSNTDGSITSTVSANQAAGFSIVRYTGDGTTSGKTVGHGLGAAAKMVIVKPTTGSFTNNGWYVSHSGMTANNQCGLQATSAQAAVTAFNNGGIGNLSSTTFTLINGSTNTNNVNFNGEIYIAYCFAEVPGFSRLDRYVGNGTTGNGPFVYCGFRPKYVMVRRVDSTGSWSIHDAEREPFNPMINDLQAQSSQVENGVTSADPAEVEMLSNGFKIRTNMSSTNASYSNANGGIYIYYAIAEHPFKYANAK